MDNLLQICENKLDFSIEETTLNKILLLNGPNLQLLGVRETEIYGSVSLSQLNDTLKSKAAHSDTNLECIQSNSEHELVDYVCNAPQANYQFIIINAASFSHTSVALRDAFLAVKVPFIEVHISNIFAREEFRKKSYLSDIANGIITGLGTFGYELALDAAIKFLNDNE